MKQKLGTPRDMEGVGEKNKLRFTRKVTYARGPFRKKTPNFSTEVILDGFDESLQKPLGNLRLIQKPKKKQFKKMNKNKKTFVGTCLLPGSSFCRHIFPAGLSFCSPVV